MYGKHGGTTNMNAAGLPIAGDVDSHPVDSPAGRTTLHLFQINKGGTGSDQRPDYAACEPDLDMTPQGRVACCASQSRTLRRARSKIRS